MKNTMSQENPYAFLIKNLSGKSKMASTPYTSRSPSSNSGAVKSFKSHQQLVTKLHAFIWN